MMKPSRVPEWVPVAVRNEAERMLADTDFSPDEAKKTLIRRLLTDAKMEQVWHVLRSPRRVWEGAAEWWTSISGDALSYRDSILSTFFFYAVEYAKDARTQTIAEREALRQQCCERANQLRQTVDHLLQHWPDHPDAQDRAAAMREAISFYEQREKFNRWTHVALVGRNRGNPHQRGYALEMAHVNNVLFDQPLCGTVAKVTNVALADHAKEHVVSGPDVADWVKATSVDRRSRLMGI
jgi:hypothetical protein